MGEKEEVLNMTIAKQALLTDLDYSAWANQRLLDACSALIAEELDRDLGASHGGVIRTLRHIYYAERVWMKRLRANSLPPLHEVGDQRLFSDAPAEPDLEALKKAWPEVWSSLREWLEPFPDAELEFELSCHVLNGDELRLSRWKLILHMVNHSTLHRGQVIGMLRAFGKQPPNLDLFSFYMLEAGM
jgi:uncharacterized damage-inducible protein DinB